MGAQAQGIIQFNATLTGAQEVPPNNDPTIGQGYFTLDGNSLSFLVDIPAVTFISVSGYIQGPALPGSTAPIIFDLGGPVFHSGSSLGDPPVYRFASPASPPFGAGPFTLSDAQITDLLSGLWYVNITSAGQPDGQLRGQILEVPEPSTWTLFGLGSLGFWCWRKRRTHLKLALAVCAFAVLHSGSAQPGCTFCPPNHSYYTLTVPPGWSLIANPLPCFDGLVDAQFALLRDH